MAYLEIIAMTLNFLGGLLLVLDALEIRRSTRRAEGSRILRQIVAAAGGVQLRDPSGRPLESDHDFQLWLSRDSFRRAWLGFALITGGFFLQIVAALLRF